MEEENKEEKKAYLMKDQEEYKEEEAEQRKNMSYSKPTSQGTICSLIIHGESCIHNVSLGKTKLHASAHPHPNNLFQLHTPQKHSHHLFTCGKPSQKAPNHPSNYHQVWIKPCLFEWLVLFQQDLVA